MNYIKNKRKYRLIVHGGAWNIPDTLVDAHLEGITEALVIGNNLIRKKACALDIVEKVVNYLEKNPTFDAGKGSFLNSKGEIEMDAIIVDGSSINFGSVAGIRHFLHPISIARKVMENTPHCFMIGEGAEDLAMRHGLIAVKQSDLVLDREKQYLQRLNLLHDFHTIDPFQFPSDTVGAVVMDCEGNVAAGTSTGGTPRKLAGRVGDAPIFGAGAYADNFIGGSSTTGHGEEIMRSFLAKTAVERIANGSAMDQVLRSFYQQFQGRAGVIAIDKTGRYHFGHNTPRMAMGFINDEGKNVVSIGHKKEPPLR